LIANRMMKRRGTRLTNWAAAKMLLLFLLLGMLLGAQQTAAGDHLVARCLAIGQTPDARTNPPPQIAPGAPPLLRFRYYEGAAHHRYGNQDLMLDDAGH
jgi:hypothetical protein